MHRGPGTKAFRPTKRIDNYFNGGIFLMKKVMLIAMSAAMAAGAMGIQQIIAYALKGMR